MPGVVDDLENITRSDGSTDGDDGDIALAGHAFEVRATDPDNRFGEIIGAEFLAAFFDARCGVFDMGDDALLNSASRHAGGSFNDETPVTLNAQNTHRDVRRS